MSEPYKPELMPQAVKTARLLMWIQVAIPLLGFVVLFIFFLGGSTGIGGLGILPFVLILSLAITVLVGVLAASCTSRKRWVRITALVIESLMILEEGYGLVTGPSFNGLISLTLAVVVVVQLSRPVASAWFDR
jgi:hypothetical protein